MSRGWMKAGSDWCIFLPLGEESSELGSMDDSPGLEMMLVVNMRVI